MLLTIFRELRELVKKQPKNSLDNSILWKEYMRTLISLKGNRRKIWRIHRDQVILSKELATISLDVPLNLTTDDLERKEMNREALEELFNELEFKNIATRILAGSRNSESHRPLPGPMDRELFLEMPEASETESIEPSYQSHRYGGSPLRADSGSGWSQKAGRAACPG